MNSVIETVPTSIAPLNDGADSADRSAFDSLLQAAVDHIQAITGDQRLWTDFNLHDPGVTLLEAVIWAMSDLSYRSAVGSHWDRRVSLTDSWALLPHDGEAVDTSVQAKKSENQTEPDKQTGASVEIPSQGTNRRAWLRFLLDFYDQLFPNQPAHAVGQRSFLQPLWEAFVAQSPGIEATAVPPPWATVAKRIRTSLLEELPADLRAEIAQRVTGKTDQSLISLWAEIKSALGWTPNRGDVLALAANHADIDFPPQRLEDDQGGSLVWPPHRTQVTSIKPCTAVDYASHLCDYLQQNPPSQRRLDANRIWVDTGLACGVTWDGLPVTESNRRRPGAISLLMDQTAVKKDSQNAVESLTQQQASEEAIDFLQHCRRAFYDAAPRQVRYWGQRELNARVEINRCLCDELCIGIVGRQVIRLHGRILHDPTLRSEEVRTRVLNRLSELFYCGIENVWHEDDVHVPKMMRGWKPGSAIRLLDISRVLLGLNGVERVVDLVAATDANDSAWQAERLDLPNFTVPQLGETKLLFQSVINAT